MIEAIIVLLSDPVYAEKYKLKEATESDMEDIAQNPWEEDEQNKQKDLDLPLEGAP